MKTSCVQNSTSTLFALLLFTLALAASAHATAYVSNASGTWATTTIWTPNGTPTASDSATILSTHTVTIAANATAGSITINSGGTLSIGNDANARTLTVAGSFTNNGTITTGNTGGGHKIIFSANGAWLGSGDVSACKVGVTVNSGVTLDISGLTTALKFKSTGTIVSAINGTLITGTQVINGNANATHSLTLASGATLITANPNGIINGTVGTINFAGTVTLNTAANYTFNGTAAQVTLGLPATVSTLTITNNAGVTLSANTTVTGTLALNVGGSGEYTDANIATLLSSGQLGGSPGTLTLANGAVLGLNPINASSSAFTCNSTIADLAAGVNILGLNKPGAGTLILGGNNTFTGPVTLPNAGSTPAGWIQVASSTALGPDATSKTINLTSSVNDASGGIQLIGGVTVNNKHITIGGRTAVSTSRFLQNVSGSNTWNGNLSIANSGGIYYIQSDAGTLVLGGAIQNTVASSTRGFALQGAGNGIITGTLMDGSVTAITALSVSAGAGTWNLTGFNTFSGGTTIAGGKLVVSGQSVPNSGTGSGVVAVNAGTLSGNGRVGGNVTVASSATAVIYPNISGGGTLTLGGTLIFSGANSGAKFNLSATVGGANDKVVLENQAVTITGSPAITINLASTTLDVADYVLVDAGSGTISGSFKTTPVFTGATPKYAGQYSIVTSSHQVTLHYTPIALTVTAAANSKTYDGGTTAAAAPTVTSGSLASGDTGNFTEIYDNKDVGVGNKTLTPSGTITATGPVDVTSRYQITFTPITTGTISAQALTIIASAQSKLYGTALSLGTTAFSVGSGLVPPEAVTAVTLTASGGTGATDAGGTYTITPSTATGLDGFLPANYNLTYATGSLRVNPATASSFDLATTTNTPVTFNANKLVLRGSDAGVTLSVSAVTSPSAHGTVVLNGDHTITYTPATDYTGGDSFTYTLSDNVGGSSPGTVSVTVHEDNGVVLSIVLINSMPTVTTFAIPGYTYHLQSSDDSGASWQPLSTVMAATNGYISYADTDYANHNSRMFRLVQ